MSSEMTTKLQTLLWWITSIAVSVLCCSILFVLFASYMVDMKSAVQESDVRITAIEERENQILTEIELIRKHSMAQPVAVTVAPPGIDANAPASIVLPGPSSVTPLTAAPPAPSAPTVAVPSLEPATPTPPVAPPASK